MANTKFVLGVDLDGVVADFYGGLRQIAAEWLDVPIETLTQDVTCGLPEWSLEKAPGGYDALHRFSITQRELSLNLKPVSGAPIALRRLSAEYDIRIRIITHRLFIKYFHQTAIRQTVEWLDAHDIPYWDLCFMKDKAAVGADLYIEASPQNVEALRQTNTRRSSSRTRQIWLLHRHGLIHGKRLSVSSLWNWNTGNATART